MLHPHARDDDRGQATLLMVLVMTVAIGAGVLLTHVGAVAIDRARARTAADAAALAAAADGPAAATAIAQRNGGVVEAVRADGAETEVTVRVGQARATSRARRDVIR